MRKFHFILIAALICLLFYQCSPTSEDQEIQYKSFAHYAHLFKHEFQQFSIKANKDTTLKAEKGLEITIPKDAFRDVKTDQPINIRVKEYTSPTDYLFANATTTSNNNLLVSGGCAYIVAFQGEQMLELKDGVGLQLTFPPTTDPMPMATYYGGFESGEMNWKLDTTKQEILNRQVDLILPRRRDNPDYYKGDIVTRITIQVIGSPSTQPEILLAIGETLNSINFELPKVLSNSSITFERNTSHKVLRYTLSNKQPYPQISQWLVDTFSKLEAPIERITLSISPFKSPLIQTESNAYVLRNFSTKLGWINCDYLYKLPESERCTVKVKSPNMRTNAFILLNNRRSILFTSINPEENHLLSTPNLLPKGQEATIVAFTSVDDKELIAIKSITIEKQQVYELDFQEMSKEEIMKNLQLDW